MSSARKPPQKRRTAKAASKARAKAPAKTKKQPSAQSEPFDPIAARDVAAAIEELDVTDREQAAERAGVPDTDGQAAADATEDAHRADAANLSAEWSRWPPVSYWMKVAIGVIAVVAAANMLVALRQIIILLLISLILAIGLQPGVTWLERKGIRRGGAVALIFFTAAFVVIGFLALITPTIIRQIGQLVSEGPDYIDRAQKKYKFFADLNMRFDLQTKLKGFAEDLPSTALSFIKSFTAFLFNGITVMILTLYFATALPKMEAGVARLLRRDKREDFQKILEDSTGLVGGYMLGNLIVSLIAGVVSFIALLLIGVPYPAALAFWIALADLIPTVGALLGAAAAVLIAVFAGVPQLIGTIIFFAIYQQIENYVIAPRVMTRTVEMSAAAVIVAVLVGVTLAGFPGALLALPAAAIIKVTLTRLYLESRLEAVRIADATDDAVHRSRLRLRLRRHPKG